MDDKRMESHTGEEEQGSICIEDPVGGQKA